MRYVIVSVVNGDAGDFNNNLRKDIKERFNLKSSKLPAHFTIKAPFEYDGSIEDLEENIDTLCRNEKAAFYNIKGYDNFDDRVIYMKVYMSKEGKVLHDKLIDSMDKSSYITFDSLDGKEKVFHVTIASKKLKLKYNELWNYVSTLKCDFKCKFDNISIYKWEEETWKLHRAFELK